MRAATAAVLAMALPGSLPFAPSGRRWWRASAYRAAAFDGGAELAAGLISDFRRGRYALPMGLTPAQILAASPAEIAAAMRACSFADVFEFGRASVATGVVSGQLAAAGQPRLEDGGLLLEGPATNKVTARKHNPVDTANLTKGGDDAATLTVVDDVAALAAAGLSGVCASGKVYRLDNSGGASSAWAIVGGATGNTVAHALSAYVRGGSGNIQFSGGLGGSIGFVASANYRRVSGSLTPADATRNFALLAYAGQVIYFILPQLEEGAFATSVIPGDALSTVARAADNAKLTARAAAVLQRASAGLLVQGQGVYNNNGRLIGTTGGLERIVGFSGTGTPIFLGSAAALDVSGPVTHPLPAFGIAGGWSAAGKAGSYNGRAVATQASALDTSVAVIYLGRNVNGTFASGYYHQLVAWPERPANAALPGKAIPYV